MIISRTPFRISFAGGGTDIPDFYRLAAGAVTATAIDKFMYISVHRPFDNRIRVKYSRTELVDDVAALEHPVVREALRLADIRGGIEITSVSDIPAKAGLGSSSSFAVGLMNVLHAFKGEHASAERLAQEACEIEIARLGEPIGKQDQYIAAYGGLQHVQFNPDESVFVDPVICPESVRREFHSRLLLFHCGGAREAREILGDQKKNIPGRVDALKRMAELARDLRDLLAKGGDVRPAGEILHESWLLKKTMSGRISSGAIDGWYERARAAGAAGGKLLGAGGGGFLLLFAEPAAQPGVIEALRDLRHVPFGFEPQGSKIIYVG